MSLVPLRFEYNRGKIQRTLKTRIASLSDEPFTYLNPFYFNFEEQIFWVKETISIFILSI